MRGTVPLFVFFRMGQFVVAFSFIIVILQATTILLQRPTSTWSFYLTQAVPNTAQFALENRTWLFLNQKTTNDTLLLTENQRQCLLSNTTDACLQHTHAPRHIQTIWQPWNPHAILLMLCCMQLLVCISKTQYNRETKQQQKEAEKASIHFPVNYGTVIIAILMLVVLLLSGLKHSDLVQYPTILVIVVLLALILWYAWTFDEYVEDAAWNLVFHMLAISVPVAVLSIATMGTRLSIDVLTHLVLLTAAGLSLWLQNAAADFGHPWSLQIVRFITIMLPTLSLTLAHIQRGAADNWRYAVALMGCAGLLPLYVFSIILADAEEKRNDKLKIRMAYLCTGGALLSLVVNLAMFNE